MSQIRGEAVRGRHDRRAARLTTPAPVIGPLASGATVEGVAIAVAVLLGLSAGAVVAVAMTVAVAVSLAARRTVTSLVAGAGMRVARPYCPGERVRLYVPVRGRVVEAEIVRVGFANTTLATTTGVVAIPNAQMLRPVAIGR